MTRWLRRLFRRRRPVLDLTPRRITGPSLAGLSRDARTAALGMVRAGTPRKDGAQ